MIFHLPKNKAGPGALTKRRTRKSPVAEFCVQINPEMVRVMGKPLGFRTETLGGCQRSHLAFLFPPSWEWRPGEPTPSCPPRLDGRVHCCAEKATAPRFAFL